MQNTTQLGQITILYGLSLLHMEKDVITLTRLMTSYQEYCATQLGRITIIYGLSLLHMEKDVIILTRLVTSYKQEANQLNHGKPSSRQPKVEM